MRRLIIGLAGLSCLLAVPRQAMPAGEYLGVSLNSIYDVSPDGSLLLGRNDSNPDDTFLWSQAKGLQRVPGRFVAASDDGQFVVGGNTVRRILIPASDLSPGFYIDTQLADPLAFGARTVAISADGSVAVGQRQARGFDDSFLGYEAFRWTQPTGLQLLGDLPGLGEWCTSADASADGQVIVGAANIRPRPEPNAPIYVSEPFRWTSDTGMVSLGFLDHEGEYGEASAISDDGRVVVGRSNNQAFRWTAETGMVDITPPQAAMGGVNYGWAHSASADGQIVFLGAGPLATTEYIWDPVFGPRKFIDFARSQGLVELASSGLVAVEFASNDGRLMYGGVGGLTSSAWGIRLDQYWPAELLMGDINVDARVDLDDFGLLQSNLNAGRFRYQGDLNGDHRVDLSDFGLLKDNFGKRLPATQPAPEPPAWTLAAIGVGLLTLRLRRWAKLG